MNKKTISILVILLTASLLGFSQKNLPVKVLTDTLFEQLKELKSNMISLQAIRINGNKKTRDFVILGEMNLKIGERIDIGDINRKLQSCAESVYNSNLFSEVTIEPVLISNDEFIIKVNVVEKWTIYPLPYFQLSDRNFNEWWSTYHGDLKRTIYGVVFSDFNFSGTSDRLNIGLLNGFSKLIAVNYSSPITKHKTTKLFSFGAEYYENKSFAYETNEKNKLNFYNNSFFVKKNLLLKSSYIVRQGLYSKQSLSLQYNIIKIVDSVFIKKFNRSYLNDTSPNIHFPDFIYQYQLVKTNNNNYPTKGKMLFLRFLKRGFGLMGDVNLFSVDASYKRFYSYRNNFYMSCHLLGNIKIPFKQAYINQRAIGYGEQYLRGLENYVIDGVAFGVSKFTLSKKLLSYRIPMPFNSRMIPYIPLSIFAKTYLDMGYAYHAQTVNSPLNNTFLYTGGVGIDLLSLYDMRFSLEFSFNQLKEKGLFLHSRSGF